VFGIDACSLGSADTSASPERESIHLDVTASANEGSQSGTKSALHSRSSPLFPTAPGVRVCTFHMGMVILSRSETTRVAPMGCGLVGLSRRKVGSRCTRCARATSRQPAWRSARDDRARTKRSNVALPPPAWGATAERYRERLGPSGLGTSVVYVIEKGAMSTPTPPTRTPAAL
jgi:hypothetical protein